VDRSREEFYDERVLRSLGSGYIRSADVEGALIIAGDNVQMSIDDYLAFFDPQ